MSENEKNEYGKGTIVKLVYFLFIMSFFFGGSTLLVALIINIFMEKNASKIELSHFKNQRSLLIKSLVFAVIGILTIPLFIGIFILIGTYIWLLIKSVKGLDIIARDLPIDEYFPTNDLDLK